MGKVFYAVTASITDPATARAYRDWLEGGHADAVIAGGAESARVVELDSEGTHRIETQYVFPSRAAFEAYEAGPAVELRADGRRRFAEGVVFERRVGEIVFTHAAGDSD